jgi:hypothetical protein
LRGGRSYYVRAFASNAEGTSYGEQVKFRLETELGGVALAEAPAVPGKPNWRNSHWFGQFYQTGTSWIYHGELGWLYLSGDDPKNLWVWSNMLGWTWTGEGVYPYLFRHGDGGWYLYMRKVNDHVVLYRYATREWIDFKVNQ